MSIAVVKPRDEEVLTKKRNFIARLFRALNMARFYRAICKESEALSRVPSFANTPSCAWLFRRETCIPHVSMAQYATRRCRAYTDSSSTDSVVPLFRRLEMA